MITASVIPYFSRPERLEALARKVAEWQTTRWRHAGARPNAMQCGVSGDCLFWVHVFKSIGALPPELRIPEYRRMEAAADQMGHIVECIVATGRALCVFDGPSFGRTKEDCIARFVPGQPDRPPRPLPSSFDVGDVLLFFNGMSGVHCGLVTRQFPTQFVHISDNGFLVEPFNQDHWRNSLQYVFRLTEEAS